MISVKSKRELAIMRDSGKMVAEVLREMENIVKPGVTTGFLDKQAKKIISGFGAVPSFLGFNGFPANICTSVNEELVHGVPGKRRLKEGDIISIDVGVYYKGYHGDAAITLPVGTISNEAGHLLKITREALDLAIEKVENGNYLSDISHAIQAYAERHNYTVTRNYVGHGIGRSMHEDPQVPNFGKPGKGARMREGMVFAIEPMVNAGTHKTEVLKDGWTVVTKDRRLSAHYEHTVAVTANGPAIMTLL